MSKDPNSTYYDAGGIEVFDIIKAKLTPEQFQGFLLGNVIKYSCRMNHKGTLERDADKCAFYARELAALDLSKDDEQPTLQELIKKHILDRPPFPLVPNPPNFNPVPPFPYSPFYTVGVTDDV